VREESRIRRSGGPKRPGFFAWQTRWSLTSLQQRLVKSGGRLIKHACYHWLQLAGWHLTRRLCAGMLQKIPALLSRAGIRRAQRGTDCDDDAWGREKCLRKRPEKESFQGVVSQPEAKLPPGGAAGNIVTKTGLNLAGGGCLVYTAVWNRSLKTEIPVNSSRHRKRNRGDNYLCRAFVMKYVAFAPCLLVLACGRNAPAFSQERTAGLTTGASVHFPALTSAANDALIACIAWNRGTDTVTLSDNNSGTWAEVVGFPHHNTVTGNTVDIWYSVGHPAGSTMVTLAYSGLSGVNLAANLSDYTGIAASTPVDTSTNHDQNSNISLWGTGTINTRNAADALVGCAWNSSGVTGSSVAQSGTGGGTPNALTSITEVPNQLVAAYQIVSSTGIFGFNWTWSGASEGVGAIVALRGTPASKPSGF
jgi:hypothetical protein